MAMQLSVPSSLRASVAINSSFNLMKHILKHNKHKQQLVCVTKNVYLNIFF